MPLERSSAAIAAAAFTTHHLPGFGVLSPLILAIITGTTLCSTLGTPAAAQAGVRFALRPVLRLGIVLLGLHLTTQQVAAVGGHGLFIIAAGLAITFVATK